MMNRWYLVPMERGRSVRHKYRAPKYVNDIDAVPLVTCAWRAMDIPGWDAMCLLYCEGISKDDHRRLVNQDDIFAFPETLQDTISPIAATSLAAAEETYELLIDRLIADFLSGQHREGGNETPLDAEGLVAALKSEALKAV
ncbi:MAG: hypothetical protein HKN01_01520 [Acidimicrobiia bacterium]|nr:hypothetical protein [Acidimicrobiia bacterium]